MYNLIIVDDEPRCIDAFNARINWRNYGIFEVYQANNMDGAIAEFKKNRIDIIICDIEMPNGSGLNLMEWLMENKYQVNCIFVTCHPEFDYMRKAIQLKCYDYILKPINYDEFGRVLNDLVKKMELLEMGEKDVDSLNWGKISDTAISEAGKKMENRNVEMEVKKYVREHMIDNFSVTELAENLHFNPQYLMRAFKAKTGISIMKYITKARMETAKKVLKDTKLPIKEVAAMTGYNDYAYFTRVFHKEYGVSPKQYRMNE